jgi:hypothetical protein
MTPTQQFWVEIAKIIAGTVGSIAAVVTVYLQLKTKAKVNDIKATQKDNLTSKQEFAQRQTEMATKVEDIHTLVVATVTQTAERQKADGSMSAKQDEKHSNR